MITSHPPPRLLAIDMDGTLLDSNGCVSERNLSALRFAQAQGAELVIATGRRHCYAMRVLRSLDLHANNALISSNGTVIRTIGSQLLLRTHMPAAAVRRLCQNLADFRNTLVLTFDTVGPDGDDSRGALVCEQSHDLHASIARWMASNEPYIEYVPHLADALDRGDPIQMMLCGSIDRMAEAEAQLLLDPTVTAVGADETPGAEITLHRTSYPDRDLSIVDILPAGCSKASALQHLTALRGLSMHDVLAIGDNWNDLPMLRAAGRAALMANAPADLQALASQHGWLTVPSNDEDGVAVAIDAAFSHGSGTAKHPHASATPEPAMVV